MTEAETARDIVSMLKAALMALPNDRTDRPETGYEQNTMSPGIHFAVELIEKAFQL